MQGGAAGPSRVLSVELLEKVQSIEAQAPRA
jgi:hypothetical protein